MLNRINKKKNKKGFTLVELVVVIAILGILASIAVPKLSGSRDKANRSAVLANLRTIESALSISEAEGKDPTSINTDGDGTSLVELGYLGAEPKGPGGATYGLSTDKTRATVTLADGKLFGFTLNNGTIEKGKPYTLSELKED